MKSSHLEGPMFSRFFVCSSILGLLFFGAFPAFGATWWDGFGGTVLTSTFSHVANYNNVIFVGGYNAEFTSNLAFWNGTAWIYKQLPGVGGPGVGQGQVTALAVFQGELYVGAVVHRAYGPPYAPSDYIIRWNGAYWDSVGGMPNPGTDDKVLTLFASGNNLYAGGDFIGAGGNLANHVARFDGTAWHAMGDGLNGQVVALTEYNGQIVAAGSFTASGGSTPASGVAVWNGTSWQSIGGPLFGVQKLAVLNGVLIAAGLFSLTGGDNIAWLDGTTWRALGGGTDGQVDALTVAGGRLYVGGRFITAGKGGGKVDARFVAAWDGVHWSPLGSGIIDLAPDVTVLFTNGTDVILGGYFGTVDGMSAVNIAVWKTEFNYWDNTYSSLGRGLGSTYAGGVYAFLSDGRSLVLGGNFTYAGGISTHGIARWDGGWHTYGDGFDGTVLALTKYNGDLIAAGVFGLSGSTVVDRIARWSGTTWEPLGAGTPNGIFALAVYDGDLIAAGDFDTIGGQPASRIARWDGTSWHPLGSGLTGGYQVRAMLVYNGYLVVGGDFDHAGGASALGLAQWDGTSWSTIGGGINGTVNSLAVSQGNLYVSGQFNRAGTTTVGNIARWNGTGWSAMGTVSAGVLLTDYFGTLLAGLNAWSGGSWYQYINTAPAIGGPSRLYAHDGDLVKGLVLTGDFTKLGGVSSIGIALYNPVWNPTGVREETPVQRLEASPNPFQRSLSVRFNLESQQAVDVTVFDIAGRRVATLLDRSLPAGPHEASWDARDAKGQKARAGVYFVRVRQGDRVDSRQIVLVD